MTSMDFEQAEHLLESLRNRGVEFRVRERRLQVRGQVSPQEARSLLDQKLAVMVLVMFDGELVRESPHVKGQDGSVPGSSHPVALVSTRR